jgi:hypothetical protein
MIRRARLSRRQVAIASAVLFVVTLAMPATAQQQSTATRPADTERGAGVQTANHAVEHFNGVELTVPKNSWAAVHVQLPCEPELRLLAWPLAEDDARLSGYTFPQDGRSYIPLSCRGSYGADVVATAGRTVRLTMTSTAPMTVDDWSASQTVNRLVALIVTDRPTRH